MRLRALWLLAPLALGGCAAWVPLALSAAGGAVTFAKDVVGFDVSWRALMAPVMPAAAPAPPIVEPREAP